MKKPNTTKLMKIMMSLFLCISAATGSAQSLSKEDSLGNEVNMIKSDVGILKKIKVSGYVQAQYQVADSAGTKSYAGGDFPAASDKRFMLRRGRIKIAYINTLSQFVMQFDVTEKGFATKDMYLQFTEPWLNSFSLKTGISNRPFGFEIPFSSHLRESPERGRMSQIIFPGERDLGVSIVFNPPKTSRFNFLTLEAGMFNGTGIATDFDKQKDFIGHLAIAKSTKNEKIKYGFGVSYYKGGWREGTTTYYEEIETLDNGVKAFKKITGKVGTIAKREYMGLDAQLSIETPIGITTLRGEFIMGTQPGTSSSSASPSTQPTGGATTSITGTATVNIPANSADTTITVILPVTGTVTTTTPNADTYFRKFNGGYFYFGQNIGNTKHQLVLKYDWYDPNTEVKGSEIDATGVTTANGKLSSTDIRYSTLGIGWIYHLDENVKIAAYYDIVTNEKTKISKYTRNLSDNVFTLRIQYKFNN